MYLHNTNENRIQKYIYPWERTTAPEYFRISFVNKKMLNLKTEQYW